MMKPRIILLLVLATMAVLALPGRPAKSGEVLQLAGLEVRMWRPELAAGQRAPLVLFSHGFHGSNAQSTFLMEALARDGYWVVAPNHADASRLGRAEEPFAQPAQWTDQTYWERGDDLRQLGQAITEQPWPVDSQRVGLVGHSLGGYTVLGLAGAWPSWKWPEVRAVVALSPYTSAYGKQLQNLDVPVMYQGGTRDVGITPGLRRVGGAYDLTPSPCCLVEFEACGHFGWTDRVAAQHDNITYYTLAFLDHYLRQGPLPQRDRSGVAEFRSK